MAAIFDNVFFLCKKCLCHLKSLENSPSYVYVRNKKSFSEYCEVSTSKYGEVIKSFGLYYRFDHSDRIWSPHNIRRMIPYNYLHDSPCERGKLHFTQSWALYVELRFYLLFSYNFLINCPNFLKKFFHQCF